MTITSTAPTLLTFDIFGTVLDWRTGLTRSLVQRGLDLGDQFDAVIDRQGELEQEGFDTYASITARSLIDVLGVAPDIAAAIGLEVGKWPLFPDAASALERLMTFCPCAAMTNSDAAHGADVQSSLGFPLTHWICAEEVRVYKPDPRFWAAVRDRTKHAFTPSWWHVSAYADYDLNVAASLGLTTIFIPRPHSRPAAAAHTFATLEALVTEVTALDRPSGKR